jgi:hypothetical protein
LPNEITAQMRKDALGTMTFILTVMVFNAAIIIVAINSTEHIFYSFLAILSTAGFIYLYIWLRK